MIYKFCTDDGRFRFAYGTDKSSARELAVAYWHTEICLLNSVIVTAPENESEMYLVIMDHHAGRFLVEWSKDPRNHGIDFAVGDTIREYRFVDCDDNPVVPVGLDIRFENQQYQTPANAGLGSITPIIPPRDTAGKWNLFLRNKECFIAFEYPDDLLRWEMNS